MVDGVLDDLISDGKLTNRLNRQVLEDGDDNADDDVDHDDVDDDYS